MAESAEREIINIILRYRRESELAREPRLDMSRANRAAYNNEWGFSSKISGQTQESIPRVATGVESFSAFIKRGIVQFGDWFSVEVDDDSPVDGDDVRRIMMCFLNNLPQGPMHKRMGVGTLLSDASKVGLLEALIIFKSHGLFRPLPGSQKKEWRLSCDLVPPEHFYPDPTGRGLYEIHEVKRDYFDVLRMAKAGIYNQAVVKELQPVSPVDKVDGEDIREFGAHLPSARHVVKLTECWGTFIDDKGDVVVEDSVATMANDNWLIRKPQPNPSWWKDSPFTAGALIRVPFTVWHKALYDVVVPLNEMLNELYNLCFDGGLASVWGVRQLRPAWLDDVTQAAGGIPPQKTLTVNETMPPGAKVLEVVASGSLPPEVFSLMAIIDKELTSASLTNEIRLGGLPPRQVKATEVVEANQSASVLMDSIVFDYENIISELLTKSWRMIVQNISDIDARGIVSAVGKRKAIALLELSKQAKLSLYGESCQFKVNGLSATMTRARDFQRILGLLQVVGANPILAGEFMRRYSPEKILSTLVKLVNLDPMDIERSDEEREVAENQAAAAEQLAAGVPRGNGAQQAVAGEPLVSTEQQRRV